MPASRAGRYPAVIAAPDSVHECPLTRHAVDSDLLDCVNDNLAVMLAQLGVNDVRTPFACQWHLGFDRDGADASVSLYRRSPDEMISEQTGWTVVARPLQVDRLEDACAELLHRGPVLLYGDAFHLQWLPYFGREHQLHSFIVDWLSPERSRVHIVDAYSNKTQWGEASPTELFLETANLPG